MFSRKQLHHGLIALFAAAFFGFVGNAKAEPLGCGAQFSAAERSLDLSAEAPKACAAQPSIVLAQRQRMQSRVPAGQEYFIQLPGQRQFDKLSAGQDLSKYLNCIELECPPGMPAGSTCWKCEEITTETSTDDG
jgi:hypothetical protein